MPIQDSIIPTLLAMLTGGASLAGNAANAASRPTSAPVPPPALPVPIPVAQRPVQTPGNLPGGTFAPAAVHAKTITPDGEVIEQDAPAMAEAVQPAAAAPVDPRHAGILEALGLGDGTRNVLRNIGGGMANLRNSGGDPFVSFGMGYGGATATGEERENADAAAATAAEKTQYDRGQDAAKTQRDIEKDRADMALKSLVEKRQAETADLTNKKTALEIRRLARQNGITTSQMLEIERIAQAAGENLSGDRRTKAIDETRDRLLKQFSDGEGISDDTGLSGQSDITATNPDTGERMKLVDGAWVPM